jgi:hypothetical protein
MTSQTQTQTQTNPFAASPAPDTRPAPVMQVIAIVVGAFLALAGVVVAIGGGGLLAAFGGDDTISTGGHRVSTPTTALESSVAEIDDVAGVADVIGDPRVRLRVEPRNGAGKGVFVGIAPAAAVDRYLGSSPVDEVTDFDLDPFGLKRDRHPGKGHPKAPADQSFWTASGSGRDSAALNWKVRDGDYRLVVMNADGRRNVDVDASVGLTAPHAPAFGWGLVGAGLLVLGAGTAAVVAGAVSLHRRNQRASGDPQ